MKKCILKKEDGTKCKASAMKSSKFCFRHNPELEEERLQASRKGGLNRQLKGKYGRIIRLNKPEDVKKFLSKVINSVWTGQIPVKVGSAMGFLARCWLDVHKAVDTDERIKELERKLGLQDD